MKKFIVPFIFIMYAFSFTLTPKDAVSYDCDVTNAFNFQSSIHTDIGHVTNIYIAGDPLDIDFHIPDPEDPSGLEILDVTGVIRNISWSGNVYDPIEITLLVSNSNKINVLTYIFTQNTDRNVEFSFNVYSYDEGHNRFFKAFYIDGDRLNGTITVNGQDAQISINEEQDGEVSNPSNYEMYISISPKEYQQTLNFTRAVDFKWVEQWGENPTLPSTPALSSPSNVSSTIDLTPAFTWSTISNADSYTILVDDNYDFSSPEIYQTVTTNNYTPGSDLAYGTYWWKVKTNNSSGSSGWSSTWTFVIEPPPPLTPPIADPPFDWEGKLNWDAVPGATGYDIYCCDDPYGTFTFLIHVNTNQYDASGDMNGIPKRFYYVVATN